MQQVAIRFMQQHAVDTAHVQSTANDVSVIISGLQRRGGRKCKGHALPAITAVKHVFSDCRSCVLAAAS